jgi:mRNA guanylyltransferase
METRLANRENGPIATKVADDNQVLKNIIMSFWPEQKKDCFPAPQPVSLERRDLDNLLKMDYTVCVKSDGMRFILMCYDGKAYMADRAFKFYEVKLNFNEKLLYLDDSDNKLELRSVDPPGRLGGIFDGELVKNIKNKWQFVIHDCIYIHGKNMTQFPFNERYLQVIKLVEEIWISEGSDFRISSKQFFPFRKKLSMLVKMINENKLDHKTDGLIFNPIKEKIGTGTQYHLYKWKPRNLHTFDFKVHIYEDSLPVPKKFNTETDLDTFIKVNGRVPGRVTAYVNTNGKHELYASTMPGEESEKLFLAALKENCPEFVNGNIVECEYDENDDIFRPIKIRNDKTHPNSKFTIKKTLNNITENITIEELLELSNT